MSYTETLSAALAEIDGPENERGDSNPAHLECMISQLMLLAAAHPFVNAHDLLFEGWDFVLTNPLAFPSGERVFLMGGRRVGQCRWPPRSLHAQVVQPDIGLGRPSIGFVARHPVWRLHPTKTVIGVEPALRGLPVKGVAVIRFRLLMISAGYEDGNDANSLRRDPMFKIALDLSPIDRELCSQSTISRLENLPDVRRVDA